MPQSTAPCLVSIQYRLRFSPKDPPGPEILKEKALLSISHLAGLGKLLARLTSDSTFPDLPELPSEEIQERSNELSAGLHVFGILMAAIADQAYAAVDEVFEEVTSDGQKKS